MYRDIELFSKEWFDIHQKVLLFLLNTRFVSIWFRWVLCINGDRSSVGKNKITKIMPHAIAWQEGKDFKIEFRGHHKYGKRLFYAFKPFWYMLHVWDILIANKWIPEFNLGYDSTTLYPVAGANSPVDGYVARASVNETFSTIRNGAGTASDATNTDNTIPYLSASATTDQFAGLYRNIYCFDTSPIGDGATISGVVLSIYGKGKNNQIGSPDLHVASASPASTSALASSDYGNVGNTSFGSVSYAGYSTSAYNDISLDSNGIANVTLTGVTKYSTRLSWDINNSFTGTWVSNLNSYFEAYYADFAGTTNDPKLVVTYSGVSGSPSQSPSGSQSPSASASRSQSPSASASRSQSPSASQSPSSSASSSQSPSASASASRSLSESPSGSLSPSASISPSNSQSPSQSPSRSTSPSLSPSGSLSPSPSASASPSPASYVNKYSSVGNTYSDKYTSTL